ncbi:MAG: leucine-rich repeat protein [Oscillospiraceae bacterium]|jgi:hypothetical protein|nr:leucine-rich repeat protein [Oscillospiraceae bacterium]
MRRRMLAVILALCLALGMLPGTAWAAENSGPCGIDGDNVSDTVMWQLDTATGVLTINGNGDMRGFAITTPPWSGRTKTAIIENGVTSVGPYSFYNEYGGFNALTNVTIPESVTLIGDAAFAYCHGLTHVTIPEGVLTIGNIAFEFCDELTSITIPSSMTTIERMAFYACSSLTDVYYGGSESDWANINIDTNTSGIIGPFVGNNPLLNATIHYNSLGPGMGGAGEDPGPDNPDAPDKPDNPDSDTSIRRINLPYYSGIGAQTHSIPAEWGWSLFSKPALAAIPYESYDNRLATTGLILSAAVEHSHDQAEFILRNQLGFTLVDSKNYDSSADLHPAVTFACKELTIDGQSEYIFAIVVRGTQPGNWDDYWTDLTSLWGGFDTAASNLAAQFGSFMGTTSLPDSDIPTGGAGRVKFFLTGHSLGGAMANIMAKNLSAVYGAENVFAYTFASPRTTSSTAISSTMGRGNIYNILHEEDNVPLLPPTLNDRYGLSAWFSRNKYNGMYSNFSNLTGGKSLDSQLSSIDPFKGHATEIYLSFLQTLSAGAPLPQASYSGGGGGGGVWCPVDLDIYVKTSSGDRLVGRVKDNVVDESVTKEVVIRIDGDRKYFYFPFEGEYVVKLTGTDSGTMTFFAQTMDYDTGEPIEGTGTVFENVDLTSGKEFVSEIAVEDGTTAGVMTEDVRLYVIDSTGEPEKEVLPDGSGTEVPITKPDEPDTPDTPSKPTYPTYPSKPSTPPSTSTAPTTPTTTPPTPTTPAEPEQPVQPAEPETPAEEPLPFTDVAKDAYYYDAVRWAVAQGITTGAAATTFAPGEPCTRGQVVTFLWRAAGSPSPQGSGSPFLDVKPGAYYYDAVLWAVEQGITSGTSATAFSPDETVTRGQTAAFLYRAAGSPAVSGSNPFADVDSGAYYADAVRWAAAQGIASGTSDTMFSPDDACTRAHIVTFLYRAKQALRA